MISSAQRAAGFSPRGLPGIDAASVFTITTEQGGNVITVQAAVVNGQVEILSWAE